MGGWEHNTVEQKADSNGYPVESHLGKFVVLVFPNGLQGQIWSAILRSQHLSVIWESPDVSLPKALKALHQKRALPDLIVLDTRLHHLQPLQLCRWRQKHNLDTQILLVNGVQPQIVGAERQWALTQGAADLLPRICKNSLVSGASTNLRRALDVLEITSCNHQTLIKALLQLGLATSPRCDRSAPSSKLL
ncbi:MAG: hypothetical protein AAGF98_04800 [Cyanobacteria bacterium P01_H01_bin.153]